MGIFSLPQECKIVEAIVPQAGGAITGDYVSLKGAARCFVVVHVNQADVAQMTISLNRATAVAPADAAVIVTAVPIWANQDCAASDTLTAQTAAVNFQLSADLGHKQIVFEIDPAKLGQTAGGVPYDCIAVATGASNAANITQAAYYLTDLRYGAATPPSAITD